MTTVDTNGNVSVEQVNAETLSLLMEQVLPKIINKIKLLEAKNVQFEQDLNAAVAEIQVTNNKVDSLLEISIKPKRTRKAKTTKTDDARANAEKEIAQARAAAEEVLNKLTAEVEEEVGRTDLPLPQQDVNNATAEALVIGEEDAGIVVETPSAAAATGGPLSNTVDNEAPTIAGVRIDGTLIAAINYVVQQGWTDDTQIAAALGVPGETVLFVMNMSVEDQLDISNRYPSALQI